MTLRLLTLRVQPVLVYDDGTEFKPGPELPATELSLSEVGDYLASLTLEIKSANDTETNKQP